MTRTVILRVNSDNYVTHITIVENKKTLLSVEKDATKKITLTKFVKMMTQVDIEWWKTYSIRIEGK